MKRQRKVYGRRRVKMDGSTFIIELRKNGLYVRELYGRRERSIALGEIIDVLNGQRLITLGGRS